MAEVFEHREQEQLEGAGIEAVGLELLDEIPVRVGKLRVDFPQHSPCRLINIVADQVDKLRVEILQRTYRRELVWLRHGDTLNTTLRRETAGQRAPPFQ